jgi:hypothetical protein
MWRHLVQRLGVGYLLLLLALIALGGATDACIQAFGHHVHFPLEGITGLGITARADVLSWAWRNPGCVVFSFMIPWWIGAFALMRSKSEPSLQFFAQVVLGVLSTSVAQMALFLWCAADLSRSLQLWSHANDGYAIWIFLAAFLVMVVLVVARASRLIGK